MIGRLVDHILEAGFHVLIYNRKTIFVLKISQEVEGEIVSVDWAITREDLQRVAADGLLLELGEERIEFLRKAIEDRRRKKGEEVSSDDHR